MRCPCHYQIIIVSSETDPRCEGVALFIHKSLTDIERYDLNIFTNSDVKGCFIETDDYSMSMHIVGVVYRPHCLDINNFMTSFDYVCSLITNAKQKCILAGGDYNI